MSAALIAKCRAAAKALGASRLRCSDMRRRNACAASAGLCSATTAIRVSTALLAGEAYADSAVVDLALKAVTSWMFYPEVPLTRRSSAASKSPFKGSSFPSGHAAAYGSNDAGTDLLWQSALFPACSLSKRRGSISAKRAARVRAASYPNSATMLPCVPGASALCVRAPGGFARPCDSLDSGADGFHLSRRRHIRLLGSALAPECDRD